MIRYYVTDRRQGDILASAARAIREHVDMIQVREKDLSGRELFDLVCRVRDLASGTGTRVFVNERLDVALAAGIDGLHLPSNGLPPQRVRPFVKHLGVSVHTLEEAVAAEAAKADFVVFGPVFATPGKHAVGLEPLRRVASAVKIPVLAIGGITLENSHIVVAAGASGLQAYACFRRDQALSYNHPVMFGIEQVLAIIGVVVLAVLIPAGLLFLFCKTVWKKSQGKVMQVFSIVISSLAIAIALIGLGGATIWQGSSGEWAPIALLPAFLISLPAGVIALVISLVVRTGVSRLRKISIVLSLAALVSPFLAAFWAGR